MRWNLILAAVVAVVGAVICTVLSFNLATFNEQTVESSVFPYITPYLCESGETFGFAVTAESETERSGYFACLNSDGSPVRDASTRFMVLLFGVYFLFFFLVMAAQLFRADLRGSRQETAIPHYGDDVAAAARAELQQGRKIAAIKQVREMTGADLITAKAYVEWLERED